MSVWGFREKRREDTDSQGGRSREPSRPCGLQMYTLVRTAAAEAAERASWIFFVLLTRRLHPLEVKGKRCGAEWTHTLDKRHTRR